jgi:hypothetical protein
MRVYLIAFAFAQFAFAYGLQTYALAQDRVIPPQQPRKET